MSLPAEPSSAHRAVGGAGRVAPPRITVAGRTLVTRAELARLSGLTVNTWADLYARRVRSGHPCPVHVDHAHGAALYFDEEAVLRWYRSRQDRRSAARRIRFTAVDRTGEPDDLLSTTEAARVLGYHGAATIRAYLSRFPGYFPAPDRVETLGGGRERRLWRRATIWSFAERLTRPVGAAPTGTTSAAGELTPPAAGDTAAVIGDSTRPRGTP